MRIVNDKEFKDLLIQTGWVCGRFHYTSPYDTSVHCYSYRREFRKDGYILGTIANLRDVIWDYDNNTGLLQNGVFAIRIK